jgi:hypothetical protein
MLAAIVTDPDTSAILLLRSSPACARDHFYQRLKKD